MADKDTTESKPKFDVKKILTYAFAAFNFFVVGGGAYLAYAGTLGHKTKTASEIELNQELVEFRKSLEEPAVVYSMEPFNTNLDGLPRRFVRLEMSIEMYDKEGFEELVTLGGQSRDAITRILNSKKFEDLETVQGKLHLKNDLATHLNDALQHGVVKNIYFTKFQVQ
jgi:flagellar basal body-associated protein FliL